MELMTINSKSKFTMENSITVVNLRKEPSQRTETSASSKTQSLLDPQFYSILVDLAMLILTIISKSTF